VASNALGAPTETEQAEAYCRVLEAFGPERPVVIRLADIGADKAISYLQLAPEQNHHGQHARRDDRRRRRASCQTRWHEALHP
jgi:phosphoenolpyruvate-protein kinase (PTS system EI component)